MKHKGKILKIKCGYNPNSSSIGTHINVFLLGSVAFGVAVNTLAAFIAGVRNKEKPEKDKV